MLNSGKKICTLRDKKNKYSNSVLSETKNHNPPPFKLNGRSLTKMYFLVIRSCKVSQFNSKFYLKSIYRYRYIAFILFVYF